MAGRYLMGPVEGRLLRRAKCMYLSLAMKGRKIMAGSVDKVVYLEGRQNRIMVPGSHTGARHDRTFLVVLRWSTADFYTMLCAND